MTVQDLRLEASAAAKVAGKGALIGTITVGGVMYGVYYLASQRVSDAP